MFMPAPTLVQYSDGASILSTVGLAYGSNVTKGNLLVCFADGSNGAPTDSLGNTWTQVQSIFIASDTLLIEMFVCPASVASGANTVKPTSGSGFMALMEFTPSVFQAMSAGTEGGTSPSIAGAANQLLVELCESPNSHNSGQTITGVGAGFTQASGTEESSIAMGYQTLSGSGNVQSAFTTNGGTSQIGCMCFTLSSIPTPISGTPSIVQVNRTGVFPNNVANGDSLLAVGTVTAATNTPLTISDTFGNTWAPIMSAATPISGGYALAAIWFCAASKSGGADTVSVSAGANIYVLELTPCSVGQNSGFATGNATGADIVSSSIAAVPGQLLVAIGELNGSADDTIIGWPMAGFEFLVTPTGFTRHGPNDQFAIQNVVSAGNYNSDFSLFTVSALFDGVYQTGVLSLSSSVFSISGNAGVAGALVTYSGTSSGSVTADGSGNFTIPNLVDGGTFTITPLLTNYSFSPSSAMEVIQGSNITGVNFTATNTTTYSISGRARVPGAVISYSGTASGSAVADANGNYVINSLQNGTYVLDLTGLFCTSRCEREFTRRTAGYANQEV
jgi:hypothetical protein